MKCKFCQAEMDEHVTICPVCGKENAGVDENPEYENPVTKTGETDVESGSEPEISGKNEKTQAPDEWKKGIAPWKMALAIAGAVLVLAVLIALLISGMHRDTPESSVEASGNVDASGETAESEETAPATIPADGNPDDVTCKGSYTVTDEEILDAAHTVVATMGDRELTNGQLQIFYWMEVFAFVDQYGGYTASMGLDLTKPLDTQLCQDGSETPTTWQQFFLTMALESWKSYQAMSIEAEKGGFEMEQSSLDELKTIPEEMDKNALEAGFLSGQDMLAQSVGVGATVEDYVHYLELYYHGYSYFNAMCESMEPSAEEIRAYFEEHEQEYQDNNLGKDSGKYINVRHILLQPEGGKAGEDGHTMTYTEQEWAACKAAAQKVLDSWLSGDQTEDSFASLAGEHSQDPGSVSNGGLYENVSQGDMVAEFDAWCFDEGRKSGDTGLVKTQFGYHVMYFVGSEDIWYVNAKRDLFGERVSKLVPDTVERNPAVVDYSAIALGFVNLAEE